MSQWSVTIQGKQIKKLAGSKKFFEDFLKKYSLKIFLKNMDKKYLVKKYLDPKQDQKDL